MRCVRSAWSQSTLHHLEESQRNRHLLESTIQIVTAFSAQAALSFFDITLKGPADAHSRAAPCLLRPLPLPTTPTVSPGRSVSPTRIEIKNECYLSSKVQAVISEIHNYPNEKKYVTVSCPYQPYPRVLAYSKSSILDSARSGRFTAFVIRLDLTAASRVHLLEPQWNPSLEDQALARAHRLGQEHPVTTLRYVIRDSIEEVSYLCSPNTKRVLSRMVYGNNIFVAAYPRRAGPKEAASLHTSLE